MSKEEQEEHERRMMRHALGKTTGKKQVVLQLTNEEVDLLLRGLQHLLSIRANFCEPTKREEISIEQIAASIKMQTGKQ